MDMDEDKCWFAAKTKLYQEVKIKERLDELSIENFLPQREELKIVREVKKKVMKPLIPCMIFVRTDRKTSFDLLNECGVAMKYILDRETRKSLVIPDKQMQDFISFVDFSQDSIEVINENLRRGDRVRVMKGNFAGIEGELIRIKGHKRVVVRLDGLFSLATNAYIPKAFIEKIEKNEND